MSKFLLPPGAKQVEMQDGTFLRGRGTSKRGRVVETDNPAHAKAIKAAGREHGHIIEHNFHGGGISGESRCEPCNFTGFAWQKTCPRCGGGMEKS